MNKLANILIVDDELPIREVLSASLKDEGHTVWTASDGESGIRSMREYHPEIVFLDIWMPGSLDGIEVLTSARKQFPHIEFVMISGHGTIETAVKATKLGAWDFIEKPLSMDKISIVISNILQFQQEKIEKTALLNKLRKSIALHGEASKMIALKQMIVRTAPQNNWVLLKGENGSGKELVAQNIHYMSPRAGRPFIELNCSSIPEELLDAELFGYEKGAFAGAEKLQKGKLELGHGGTVFLDDISDLSLKAQERLLKILNEKKFQRMGGHQWVDLDIRLIAATSQDLEKLVEKDLFNNELLNRINANVFLVPSLREHIEDLPVLVNHFSDSISKESGFQRKLFTDSALDLMKAYSWPGNVRELKNFIERVYILSSEETVEVADLRFAGLTGSNSGVMTDLPTFREARAVFEKDYLLKKIHENNGNISKTAEAIGLERSYLHRKIKAFGIDVQKGSDEI